MGIVGCFPHLFYAFRIGRVERAPRTWVCLPQEKTVHSRKGHPKEEKMYVEHGGHENTLLASHEHSQDYSETALVLHVSGERRDARTSA